jgi:hypothetical protein
MHSDNTYSSTACAPPRTAPAESAKSNRIAIRAAAPEVLPRVARFGVSLCFNITIADHDHSTACAVRDSRPRHHRWFTSYVGFAPKGENDVFAMGEIVLLQTEVPGVIAEARRQGIQVTAVHNHLLDETPRIVYVHVMANGVPDAVATKLRATFATPLSPPAEEPNRGNWSAIDAVLGKHSEASGMVAEYVFARRESIRVHDIGLESNGTLKTASEVVFQQLGGGLFANTGELYLLPPKLNPS